MNIYTGPNNVPAIYDLNNDTIFDFLIGNKRGGISLHYGSMDSTVSNNIREIKTAKYILFPNPSSKKINSNVPLNTSYEIYSVDGGLIQQGYFNMEIELIKIIYSTKNTILIVKEEEGLQ